MTLISAPANGFCESVSMDIPSHSALVDSFGRQIEYIRLSVTDKCNLRCFYCMPSGFKDFEAAENWLNFDEIERIVSVFGMLGVSRIRLTGGEPLVRKRLPDIVRRLSSLPGIDDLSLSTNAMLLASQAQQLKMAGIARINVSLDSLKPERFTEITRGGGLDKVLDGLMAAKQVGFDPIKINMVALRGTNDDEFIDMVEFCAEHGFTLRFIESMPVGDTGHEFSAQYMSLSQVREQISAVYDLVPGFMPGGGPAEYYQLSGYDLKIGFITPISWHFCQTCNRVRLSVDGVLYLCLGQEHSLSLRPLLRSGISDSELRDKIIEAIALKPERHEFNENPGRVVRLMSMTGG